MSSNFEVLKGKFANFKSFILEVAKSPKVQVMSNYSDIQFLAFSVILQKFKTDGKLNELVDKTVSELEIEGIHKDKITRYFLCFCDYLDLINKQENVIQAKEEMKEETEKLTKLLEKKEVEILVDTEIAGKASAHSHDSRVPTNAEHSRNSDKKNKKKNKKKSESSSESSDDSE